MNGPGGAPRAGEGGPEPLKKSLDKLLGTMNSPSIDVLSSVFGDWAEIVGEDLAGHSRPTAVDGGRLVVTADSAAWASEIRWLEKHVLDRLEKVTGSRRITALGVRVERRRSGGPGW